jgi:thiamine biosynthesis lipoprotein
VEAHERFACFGSTCEIHVLGGPDPVAAARAARETLLAWHDRFTRFEAGSELSRLNADPAASVEVSAEMAVFVAAARGAAATTGGLVDPTLLSRLEALGYRADLGAPVPLELALRLAPARRPARPDPDARWPEIAIDLGRRVVTRPPGVGIDSGGIVKGLAADVLAEALADADAFAVDCAGDLRIGGTRGAPRAVGVASPFDERLLHSFELANAGIATSGIGRRSWTDAEGRPAHHLLDPATGRPAFTGIVQATAIAPTALLAETRAKAALLSGRDGARDWLPGGGALVYDSGAFEVVRAATATSGKSANTPSTPSA